MTSPNRLLSARKGHSKYGSNSKNPNNLIEHDSAESVKNCMHPPEMVYNFLLHLSQPPSPEKQCIFNKWKRTQTADHRIFWAMVNDPQLEMARKLTHGVKTKHG